MTKTKLELNRTPRQPEDTWFWLRELGEDGPWHLRRYKMHGSIGVCGWTIQRSFEHAADNAEGDCHYLTREPAFDWEQYYLDHRDTEEFCSECIARSPWGFRLACLEALQDGE